MTIPPGDTSRLNVVPKFGFGWHIFRRQRRAIDVGVFAWHLSNAWTAPRNPSANGLMFIIGHTWFGSRKVADPKHNSQQSANANCQLLERVSKIALQQGTRPLRD